MHHKKSSQFLYQSASPTELTSPTEAVGGGHPSSGQGSDTSSTTPASMANSEVSVSGSANSKNAASTPVPTGEEESTLISTENSSSSSQTTAPESVTGTASGSGSIVEEKDWQRLGFNDQPLMAMSRQASEADAEGTGASDSQQQQQQLKCFQHSSPGHQNHKTG